MSHQVAYAAAYHNVLAEEPRSRPELRTLRETVTNALLAAGFEFDPQNPACRESGNASRYTVYHLPYQAKPTGHDALQHSVAVAVRNSSEAPFDRQSRRH